MRYGCKSTRTSWRTGKLTIPVSVPIAYDALKTAAVKDKIVGHQIACPNPKCRAIGFLRYISRWVARRSFWPALGGIEIRQTPVPMCRCAVCKKYFRVLPVEILPFKSYTRQVIETACAPYVATDRPTESLRQTVNRMGRHHPHPSAVHGWLGGLGARALGRMDLPAARSTGRSQQSVPAAALVTESASRLCSELLRWWMQPYLISACKYRSQQRREQLEACARLFDTASRLFPQAAYPWSAWEGWLETRFHVTAWDFPARFRCTAIQQHGLRQTGVSYASLNRPVCRDVGADGEQKRRKKGRSHGARSPP